MRGGQVSTVSDSGAVCGGGVAVGPRSFSSVRLGSFRVVLGDLSAVRMRRGCRFPVRRSIWKLLGKCFPCGFLQIASYSVVEDLLKECARTGKPVVLVDGDGDAP